MTPSLQARWLALTSVLGAALAHLADELGVLPGVHESVEVRLAVLDPARLPGLVVALLAAAVTGLLAQGLLRRSCGLAVAVLAAGQLGVAAGMESVARGRLELGPIEQAPVAPVVLQLAIALLAVLAVVVVAINLARCAVGVTRADAQPQRLLPAVAYSYAHRTRATVRGRAPPTSVPC